MGYPQNPSPDAVTFPGRDFSAARDASPDPYPRGALPRLSAPCQRRAVILCRDIRRLGASRL